MCQKLGHIMYTPKGSVDMIVMCALELGPGEQCQPRLLVDGFTSANEIVAIRFTMRDGSTNTLGGVGFAGSDWKDIHSQIDYNLDVVLDVLHLGGVNDLVLVEVLEEGSALLGGYVTLEMLDENR